jgi:hypothetical protein
MQTKTLAMSLSLLVVASLVSTPHAVARGFGGGGGFARGGGGGFARGGGFADGSGFAEGSGFAGGTGFAEGGGVAGMGAGGNSVAGGWSAYGGRDGAPWGLEDGAEYHYEHPNSYGAGMGRGGYGGYGGGRAPDLTQQKVPQVSNADRVAAANETYNWGFDRASKSDGVQNINSEVRSGQAAGNVSLGPTQRMTTSMMVDRGSAVRGNWNNWNAFHGRDWWDRYPNAWRYGGWGDYGYGWNWASWNDMMGLMDLSDASTADYYDYGDTITYNNNNVYYGAAPVATTTEYYDQAQQLASSGDTKPLKDLNWKPLGVYALSQSSSTNSNIVFQLAIDKNGDVAGNYYNELSNEVLPVKGKLDKKNQRVAFTVGSNTGVVYDTGLGNLLSAQAPCLVHFSAKRTEQWMLVRLQQPSQSPAKTSSLTTTGTN